jgi:hypothetical protein
MGIAASSGKVRCRIGGRGERMNLRPPGPETKNFSKVVDFSIHVSGASTA